MDPHPDSQQHIELRQVYLLGPPGIQLKFEAVYDNKARWTQ
jgi:hypothetical protein